MSEVEWGSDADQTPKPKSRVPKWAWFCGGGCLLAVIAAAVSIYLAVNVVRDATDSDKQWAELSEYIPFEQQPEGNIMGFSIPFQEMRMFAVQFPERGYSATIIVHTGAEGEKVREQFFAGAGELDLGPMFGNMGRHHVEECKLEVQGRTLSGIRFTSHKRDEGSSVEAKSGEGEASGGSGAEQGGRSLQDVLRKSTLALDLTREGDGTVIILQYERLGSLEPVSDAEALEFLSQYRIGP